MQFGITIHNPHKTIVICENNTWDKNEKVYETLTEHGIDEETA